MISRSHAPVLNHHVIVTDDVARLEKLSSERWQNQAEVFIYSVGIEAIGDHNLHPRPIDRVKSSDAPGVSVAEQFPLGRMRQIVISIRCLSSHSNFVRANISDNGIIEPGIQGSSRVRVDLVDSRCAFGVQRSFRVGTVTKIKAAFDKLGNLSLAFFTQRFKHPGVAASFLVCRV